MKAFLFLSLFSIAGIILLSDIGNISACTMRLSKKVDQFIDMD